MKPWIKIGALCEYRGEGKGNLFKITGISRGSHVLVYLVAYPEKLYEAGWKDVDGCERTAKARRAEKEPKIKRTLHINIECGDKTCAWKPGKFCPHLFTARLGMSWVCEVFGFKEVQAPKDNPEGWLQRLPECLAAEEK